MFEYSHNSRMKAPIPSTKTTDKCRNIPIVMEHDVDCFWHSLTDRTLFAYLRTNIHLMSNKTSKWITIIRYIHISSNNYS